ncbi:MAG: prepilin-type N-terminal cleavage/methylation domain-containing protein [Clostridia bacterium]|nr:prepilin-type N-terminal cleavage/methylation domain-containing protein [Clostridia bacterium]
MKKLNNKKGFTIVELVIVIAVIGILAGVLIPTFSGIVKRATESAGLQEATNTLKELLGSQAEGVNPGTMIYSPADTDESGKVTKYEAYIYANGKLILAGTFEISSNVPVNVTESDSYKKKNSTLSYDATNKKFTFSFEDGSYYFNGNATFDQTAGSTNANVTSFGKCEVSKVAQCAQVPTKNAKTITINVTGCSHDYVGNRISTVGSTIIHFTANENYTLPTGVTVKVGETKTLVANTDYTFNNGVLTIFASGLTGEGDVTITVTAASTSGS